MQLVNNVMIILLGIMLVKKGERIRICKQNELFTGFEAELGGNTSIDIHLKGKNKAQVYDVIGAHGFFGDRIHEHGNDKPLADKMIHSEDKWTQVDGPDATWKILKKHMLKMSNLKR